MADRFASQGDYVISYTFKVRDYTTLEKKMLQGFQSIPTWTTFFTRPVSGIMMVLVIFCIFSPILKPLFAKLRKPKEQK